MTFHQKLAAAATRNDSLLCVGLDIEPDMMAERDILAFLREVVAATADQVCAYSAHLGFYESLGSEGTTILEAFRSFIPSDVPVVALAYRSEQSLASSFSARGIYDVFGFDAVTVSPYGGLDAIEPFVAYRDKGVFVLCRTNNRDADAIQCLPVQTAGGTEPLFLSIAAKAREWNDYGNVGLVVSPLLPADLQQVRARCPDQVILVPEIGPMSGGYTAAVRDGLDAAGRGVMINLARPVLYASRSENYAEAAHAAAERLRKRLNTGRTAEPSDGISG